MSGLGLMRYGKPSADELKLMDEIKDAFAAGKSDRETKDYKELRDKYQKLVKENLELRRRVQSGHYFTDAELMAHDKETAREARKTFEAKNLHDLNEYMRAEYNRQVEQFNKETTDFWNKCKEEFKSGEPDQDFLTWCAYMWAIPIATLVEEFHWKPVTAESCGDNRQGLVKLVKGCLKRAIEIPRDENKDIRTYCKEITEKYGAGVIMEECRDDEV